MANLFSKSIIGAALVAISAGAPAARADRPVKLVTEQTDQGVVIRIVGQSPVDVSLRYRLELAGRGDGGNRVNQGGAATLEAGDAPRTLATIRMSGSDHAGRLLIDFADGGGYEERFGADE